MTWVNYLPTLSMVRLSSSSYSCIVSWQLTLLLLHSLAISPSLMSVFMLVLRGIFDSGRADVFNFSRLSLSVESTFSARSGLDERTKGQSSFSDVLSDTGFVEIFIVSKFSRLLLWFAYKRHWSEVIYSLAPLSLLIILFIIHLYVSTLFWNIKQNIQMENHAISVESWTEPDFFTSFWNSILQII